MAIARMGKYLRAAVATAALLGAAQTASADPITLTGVGYGYVDVRDNGAGGGYNAQFVNPLSGTHTYTASAGQSTSNATYHLSGSAFSLDFDQSRPGSYASYAQSYGYFRFIANENTTYALSGHYAVNDQDNAKPGYAYSYVHLYDTSVGTNVYEWESTQSVADPTFVLDGNREYTDPSGSGSSFGSLNGNLIAGHTYELYHDMFTEAWPDSDGGATALGGLSLTFGPQSASAVPLPASAWGGLALMGGLAAARVVRSRRVAWA